MSSKTQLQGYGTVAVVDESKENLHEATGSWVEANVILAAKLIDNDEKNSASSPSENDETTGSSSSSPPPVFRDVSFAFLFIAQLIAFTYTGIFYGGCSAGSDGTEDQNANSATLDDNVEDSVKLMTVLLATSAVIAFLVTYSITAFVLPKYPTLAIKTSLYGSLITYSLLVFYLFISYSNIWTLLFFIFVVGVNLWYIVKTKKFVPFAAVNLKMASRAISVNFGIYFVAFITGMISVVWMGFWTYTATGLGVFQDVQNATNSTGEQLVIMKNGYYYYYEDESDYSILGMKGFALILSLYWTLNVLANIIQTTTAGVTGTWCYDKESAGSCCSSAVTQSLFRSCTYSLGSICFGALLTALVSTLRVLVRYLRDNSNRRSNEGAVFIYCILACILFCLEGIIEYFNEWAYVFVGIWGLDYLQSGRRVLELFAARGCTAIISNGLASYVLLNVVTFTSLVCGLYGYIFGGDLGSFA